MKSHRVFFCAAGALALLGTGLGCSGGDASSAPTGAGGGTGTGGSGNTGTLGVSDVKIYGTVTQCAGTTPAALPQNIRVPACDRPECQDAACIDPSLVTQVAPQVPQSTLAFLGKCGTTNAYCMPIDYIATTGNFQHKTCTSLNGLEGRCISTCIPKVYKDMAYLPQADCAPIERCAPCYDPRYPVGQDDTGACSQGPCEPGPSPTGPRTKYDSCGAGAGMCVPKTLIPAAYQAVLPKDTCTQTDYLCAPIMKAQDLSYAFPKCVPSNAVFSTTPPAPNGDKGACVPHYLVDDFQPPPPSGVIVQDTCAAGELCAPCNNPLTNNTPTGACPLQ